MASLGAGGSYPRAAHAAGYSFARLVNRIVDVAQERYYDATPATGRRGDAAAVGVDRAGLETAAA